MSHILQTLYIHHHALEVRNVLCRSSNVSACLGGKARAPAAEKILHGVLLLTTRHQHLTSAAAQSNTHISDIVICACSHPRAGAAGQARAGACRSKQAPCACQGARRQRPVCKRLWCAQWRACRVTGKAAAAHRHSLQVLDVFSQRWGCSFHALFCLFFG